MRQGQRNTYPLQGMERDKVPSLRLAETFQEVVCLRLLNRQRYRSPELHRETKLLRAVRHRPAAFALAPFKIQVAHHGTDAFLKCLPARDLDPITCPR